MAYKTRQQIYEENRARRAGYLKSPAQRRAEAQERLRAAQAAKQAEAQAVQSTVKAASDNVDPILRHLATAGRIKGKVVTGALGAVEGLVDTVIGIGGAIGGVFDEDIQEGARNIISYNATEEWVGKHLDELTKYSYTEDGKIGEIIEGVASGVGQMLPTVAAAAITGGASLGATATQAVSLGVTATSAAGNAMQDAYNDGADYYQGLAYGVAGGAMEAVTEKLSGGTIGRITGIGKGFADDALKNVGKTGLARIAKEAVGEGVEEMITEAASPALKSIYKGKEGIREYGTPEFFGQVGEAGLVGALTSVAFGQTVGRIALRGGNADINEALESIKEIDQKTDKKIIHSDLTEHDMESVSRAKGENYRNIERVLKKMDGEKRAKMMTRYGFDGMFESDGTLRADFAASNGFAVSDGKVVANTQNRVTEANLRYVAPSLRNNSTRIAEDLAAINARRSEGSAPVAVFGGTLSAEGEQAYSRLKAAVAKLNRKANSRINVTVVTANPDFHGVSVQKNNIYIAVDVLENTALAEQLAKQVEQTEQTEQDTALDNFAEVRYNRKQSENTQQEESEYGTEDGEDTEILGGSALRRDGRSGNGTRQQGEDPEEIYQRLANDQADGRVRTKRRIGSSGWYGKYSGHQSDLLRSAAGVLRDLRRRSVKGIDTAGRTVSESIRKQFAQTVCKDESGALLSLFHWTDADFDMFSKGDVGFHFGTLDAAHRRSLDIYRKKNSDQSIYKEVYLNIQNPAVIDTDVMSWHVFPISYKLNQQGIVSDAELDRLKFMDGFFLSAYDSPASVELRRMLKEKGYDGILYSNDIEGDLSMIAFYPEQIYTVSENGEASHVTEKKSEAEQPSAKKINTDHAVKTLIHETTHFEEGTPEYYEFIRFLAEDESLIDETIRVLTEEKTGYGFTKEQASTAMQKFHEGEKLTEAEREFISELNAHASEKLLGGSQAFIEKLIRGDSTLAERVLGRITDAKAALESHRSPTARGQYLRLKRAEQLYMKAISAAGMGYYNGKITVREEDEEIEYSKTVTQEPAKKFSEVAVSTALYDALDHKDSGDDNLIRVSRLPQYVTENLGIDGDFYVYRDHVYENMVSKQQAEADGRPTQRGGKNVHFHDLGVERMTEAILSLNEPIMTVRVKSHDGNPTVVMMLPVEGDNGVPLYAVLSFYSDKKINGRFERKPHIVLTVSPREYFESEGARKGWAEFISEAVKDNRVLDYNKKGGYDLSVIAQQARLGDITEASLKSSIAQFRKDVNTFREKNKISYSRKETAENDNNAIMKQLSDDIRKEINTAKILPNKPKTVDPQKAKKFGNQNHEKVYTKEDAKNVIHRVLDNQLNFGEFKGILRGKTRESVVNRLWEKMNQAPDGKRTGMAFEIADYILKAAILENVYDDYGFSERQQIAMERLDMLRPYFHRVNLDNIRSEIKYKYDDRSKSIFSTFGRWQGVRAITPDQMAQELSENGWQIAEENEADAFFEIYEGYLNAKRILNESQSSYLNQILTKEETKKIKQEVAKEILRGFDYTGNKSVLNKTVNKYTKIIDDLKEKLKETHQLKINLEEAHKSKLRLVKKMEYEKERADHAWEKANKETEARKEISERTKLLGTLMNQTQKLKDLKLGTFLNASQYKNDVFKSTIEQLSRINYRGNLNVRGTRKLVANLLDWYQSDNPMLGYVDEANTGYFRKDVAEAMKRIAEGDKGLTNQELQLLGEVILPHVIHLVSNWNKVYREGKYIEAMPLAKMYVKKLQAMKHRKDGLTKRYLRTFGDPAAIMRYADGYDPNGFFTQTFEELRAGAIGAAVTERELLQEYDAFFNEKGKRAYRKHLEEDTVTYLDKEISVRHAICLYMTHKRKHAVKGLCLSGIELEIDGGRVRLPALLADDGKKHAKQEMQATVDASAKKLFDQFSEQDKKLIAIMEKSFAQSSTLKEITDKLRYGISNVLNDYYFPVIRANIAHNVDNFFAEVDRVTHLGFNKDSVQGAAGALLIEPIDEGFTRHMRGIAMYANLAIPTDNLNRLLNLNTGSNPNLPISVLSEIKSTAVGAEMFQYLKELKESIEGVSHSEKSAKWFNRFVGHVRGGFAKFQLGANVKVLFTQGSSLFAATSMLDYDCVVKGLAIQNAFAEVDTYCPLAMVRNSDNTVALAQGVLDKTGKIGDVIMKPIGAVDRFVVTRLFGACQYQIEKNGGAKLGTVENKQAAGELLKKVILETQQNALATERSAAMRSSNELLRALPMFTADAMKVFGRVIESFGENKAIRAILKDPKASEAEKDAARKRLPASDRKTRKSVGALITSSLYTSSNGCSAEIKTRNRKKKSWLLRWIL